MIRKELSGAKPSRLSRKLTLERLRAVTQKVAFTFSPSAVYFSLSAARTHYSYLRACAILETGFSDVIKLKGDNARMNIPKTTLSHAKNRRVSCMKMSLLRRI
jgi:hypothetical protein